MRVFASLIVCSVLVFAGCGSSETATDDGQNPDVIQDVVDTDSAAEDTVVQDTAEPEDNSTGVDTNTGTDTNTGIDTNTGTDTGTDEGGEDTNIGCPSGILTGPACREAMACAIVCPGDEDFRTDCLAETDQTASDALVALETCAAEACCENVFAGEQVTECVSENCADEVADCLVGDQECRDIWTCRKDCAPDDPTCPMNCIAAGTQQAQNQWIDYKNCILDIDCASQDVQMNGWPTFSCEQFARDFCYLPYQACFPPT